MAIDMSHQFLSKSLNEKLKSKPQKGVETKLEISQDSWKRNQGKIELLAAFKISIKLLVADLQPAVLTSDKFREKCCDTIYYSCTTSLTRLVKNAGALMERRAKYCVNQQPAALQMTKRQALLQRAHAWKNKSQSSRPKEK